MKVFLVVLSAVLSINTYVYENVMPSRFSVQVTASGRVVYPPIVVCYEASVTLPDSVATDVRSVVALGGEKFDDSGRLR